MTTCEPVRPVRISGATGLISAVPVLLGFHPVESLVVLGITGRRRRISPAIRVDLPPPKYTDEVIAMLASHAQRHVTEAALLCFSEAPHAHDALSGLLGRCLDHRIDVVDAIVVRCDRAEFLPDRDGFVAAPIPLPADDDPTRRALAEAAVLAGHQVLHSREELRASIAPPTGPAAVAGRMAVQRAAAELGTELADASDRAELLRRAAELALDAAVAEHRTAHRVSSATAARLALTVCDRWARDALITRVINETPGEWVPVLVDAVGQLPADTTADLTSLLAVAAYRRGDGALAQVTLDRCLAADPRHRFGLMLQEMLLAGLHPDTLQALGGPLPKLTQPASEVRRTLATINRAAGGSLRPPRASRRVTPGWSADAPDSPPAGT